MKKLINVIKKHNVLFIFLLFFLCVFIQHQFLWLYFDDYGYASLSYAYKVNNVNGLRYDLNEIISFLVGHYNVWGGRVLFYFFEIVLLKIGLPFYRLFQSLAITAIFAYSYLIITKYIKNRNKTLIALFLILLYGTFEIGTMATGIFWISASISYLIPLSFFLPFVYYLDKYNNYVFKSNLKKVLSLIGLSLLVFISSFSQEQVASLVISYMILYTGYNVLKSKKINKDNLILCIISLIGFLIMMLAPGNSARMNENANFYSLSLIGKIFNNFPILLKINFSAFHNRFFAILFFICQLYVSYINNKEKTNIFSKIALASSILIVSITLFSNSFYFDYVINYFNDGVIKIILIVVMIFQMLLILYSYIIYFYNRKQIIPLFILLSSYVSQAILIYSPVVPNRCSIPFMILTFIIFGMTFINFLDSENKNDKIGLYLVVMLGIMSIINFYTITKGYYVNNSTNKYNHVQLKKASNMIKSGKNIKKIKLKKLKNDVYTCTQPYMDGSEFIVNWIKEYYDIPSSVEIVYY